MGYFDTPRLMGKLISGNYLKAIEENPVDVLRDGSLWTKPTRRKRMIPSDNIKDMVQRRSGAGQRKSQSLFVAIAAHWSERPGRSLSGMERHRL
jgi:hypothetical protein